MKASLLSLLLIASTGAFAPLGAQGFRFPDTGLVDAAERFGKAFPTPAEVPPLPPGFAHAEGTAERVCVEVSGTTNMTRSGEMLVGGHLERLHVGMNKVWWKPLNSSLDMKIQVVGVSMLDPGTAIEFEVSPPSAPYENVRPLRQIPEEAFFPAGATFSHAGKWIAMGVSGSDWGCFIFEVPPQSVSRQSNWG